MLNFKFKKCLFQITKKQINK